MNPGDYHCGLCGVCITDYDHHCVFFTKCIGGAILGSFKNTIIALIVISIYFAGMVVADSVYS